MRAWEIEKRIWTLFRKLQQSATLRDLGIEKKIILKMSLQNLCENVCWIQLSHNKSRTHNLPGLIRDLVKSGNGVSINKILKSVTFGKDMIF
jgi:hypothetical protein